MKHLGTWVVLGVALVLSGCAAGLANSADADSEVRLLTETVASAPRVVLTAEPERETVEQPTAAPRDELTPSESSETPIQTPMQTLSTAIQLANDVVQPQNVAATVAATTPSSSEPPEVTEETVYGPQSLAIEPAAVEAVASDERRPASLAEILTQHMRPAAIDTDETEIAQVSSVARQDAPLLPNEVEGIVTPQPVPRSPFRPGPDESEQDRFDRRVIDVPVDLRPTEGEMPEDLAAARLAGEPTIDETIPSDMPPDIFCTHTPWTFCYRPLYFEDIKLERYGENVGYLQTGLSGVRFFGSIAALPYKMTVRPPRSCQCSNGFSRCGDCPLPGYGRREFRIDASLIEAAAVAGVVYILP